MRQIFFLRVASVLVWVVLIAGVLLVAWFVVTPKAVIEEPIPPVEQPVVRFADVPAGEPTALPAAVVYVTGCA